MVTARPNDDVRVAESRFVMLPPPGFTCDREIVPVRLVIRLTRRWERVHARGPCLEEAHSAVLAFADAIEESLRPSQASKRVDLPVFIHLREPE